MSKCWVICGSLQGVKIFCSIPNVFNFTTHHLINAVIACHGQLRYKIADLCLSVSWPLFGLKHAPICQPICDMTPVVGIGANELCFESGTPPRGVTSVACIETVNRKTKAQAQFNKS